MTISISEDFDSEGYVVLKDWLHKDSCENYASKLDQAFINNKTENDTQCPKSDSIYGLFDDLLETVRPNVEQVSGKKLFPTYSYARIYRRGDVLEAHTDRPSCEISLTLCLKIRDIGWDITMEGYKETKSYILDVGDAVLYYGCDVPHWRENSYEGEALYQVFLHYVDAEGEYAQCKFDGREALSESAEPEKIQQMTKSVTKSPEPEKIPFIESIPFWFFENAISDERCMFLRKNAENYKNRLEPGSIGEDSAMVDESIRNVNKFLLDDDSGIAAELAGKAMVANYQAWQFELSRYEQCEYLWYNKDGRYIDHVDAFIGKPYDFCRKLTAHAFINNTYEGGKFFLKTGHEKMYPPQDKGTIIVFPSFMMHGVEDVTEGERHAIVCWIIGPQYK